MRLLVWKLVRFLVRLVTLPTSHHLLGEVYLVEIAAPSGMPGGRAATGQIRRPQGSCRKATHTDRGKVISGKAAFFRKTGLQKTSGKQTDSPAQQESGTRPGRVDFGAKVCRNEKKRLSLQPGTRMVPPAGMHGIDTQQPRGVAQGQSRGQGRERRGVAQSG